MPLTPRFAISQGEAHVNVEIRVPHVRVSVDSIQVALSSSPDCDYNENDEDDNLCHEGFALTVLHFSSPPYLLVLNFAPYQFHEMAAEACASYEPTIENGMVRLSLRKLEPGVFWENLDLVGRMAQPKKNSASTSQWLKEVTKSDEKEALDAEEDHPSAVEEKGENQQFSSGSYGFLKMFTGIFVDLSKDGLAKEMLELEWDHDNVLCLNNNNKDNNSNEEDIFKQRRQQRWSLERGKVDKDRWLQDLDMDDDYIYQCAMSMKPHWRVQQQDKGSTDEITQGVSSLVLDDGNDDREDDDDKGTSESGKLSVKTTTRLTYFTEDEQLKMMGIPYPILPRDISEKSMDALLLGLFDILFAYVYEHLTTGGEPTVESAWTISTLSASLSCLEDFSDVIANGQVQEEDAISVAVVSSFRRSLIYPYIRNLDFANFCGRQVADIFQVGPRCIIRCLLQTRKILEESELYYLGNKLYLDPYLAWLQKDTSRIAGRLCHWESMLWQSLEKVKALGDLDLVDFVVGNDECQKEGEEGKEEGKDDGDEDNSSEGELEDSNDEEDDASTATDDPCDRSERDDTVDSQNESLQQDRRAVSDALLDHKIGQSLMFSTISESKQ